MRALEIYSWHCHGDVIPNEVKLHGLKLSPVIQGAGILKPGITKLSTRHVVKGCPTALEEERWHDILDGLDS